VYSEYGLVERTTGEYEVDHDVPLEAGGSNDIANLWPEAAEPRPGFHEKDQVENYLHDQVCAGTMSLLDAQRAIATNWLDVYRQQSQRAAATVAPPLAPAPPAGTRERCPDHFRRWIGPRWTRDRRRADHAWSFLFHRVPNPGRDILNSSGTRLEDRGRERHGVVDLGDRSFNPPRHRHRGGDVQ